MRLSEAADVIGVTKQTLWRAVKAGKLEATRKKRGGKRKEYDVTEDALAAYKREFIDSMEVPVVTTVTPDETPVTERSQRNVTDVTGETLHNVMGVTPDGSAAEMFSVMLDRLTRAERRAVELEITLRQHQNLLTENAESLQENRAEVLEAEAKVKAEQAQREAKEAELVRLTEELKEARTTIVEWETRRQRPWWKKMFNAG